MIAMNIRGIEKWLDFQYNLKVESTGIVDELVVRCGEREESSMTSGFGA